MSRLIKRSVMKLDSDLHHVIYISSVFASSIFVLSSILFLNFATEWGNSANLVRISSILIVVMTLLVSIRTSWISRIAVITSTGGSLLFLNSTSAGTCDLVGYTNAPWGFSFHLWSNTIRYGLNPSHNQYACSTSINWMAMIGGAALVLCGLLGLYHGQGDYRES